MRYIRYLFLASLGLVLLTVALANRGAVTLSLFPEDAAVFMGQNPQIDIPLFLIIFGGIIAGIVIGFIWEWLREHKHRAEASTQRRERERLEREVDRLRGPKATRDDDVLAILDKSAAR